MCSGDSVYRYECPRKNRARQIRDIFCPLSHLSQLGRLELWELCEGWADKGPKVDRSNSGRYEDVRAAGGSGQDIGTGLHISQRRSWGIFVQLSPYDETSPSPLSRIQFSLENSRLGYRGARYRQFQSLENIRGGFPRIGVSPSTP